MSVLPVVDVPVTLPYASRCVVVVFPNMSVWLVVDVPALYWACAPQVNNAIVAVRIIFFMILHLKCLTLFYHFMTENTKG